MLERIVGFSLSRFVLVTALLLGALIGCNQTETGSHGHVDVIPSGLHESACETPILGHLRFDGLLVADVAMIPADELCHNWIVRKELPAGLYTVSWQADSEADEAAANDSPVSLEVRDAGIVNVFPDRTTTVRVLRVEPEADLPSQALLVTDQ